MVARHVKAIVIVIITMSVFSTHDYRGAIHLSRPHGGGGGQAQVDACGRGEGGPAPCGRPHRKLKLESTDVILSSSHSKKLAPFLPEFGLWTERK